MVLKRVIFCNTKIEIFGGRKNSLIHLSHFYMYLIFLGGSSESSSGGSLSSPGINPVRPQQQQQQQQQHSHFDVAKAIFNQVDTNRDGTLDRNEFQQWAQGGTNPAAGQRQQQPQ